MICKSQRKKSFPASPFYSMLLIENINCLIVSHLSQNISQPTESLVRVFLIASAGTHTQSPFSVLIRKKVHETIAFYAEASKDRRKDLLKKNSYHYGIRRLQVVASRVPNFIALGVHFFPICEWIPASGASSARWMEMIVSGLTNKLLVNNNNEDYESHPRLPRQKQNVRPQIQQKNFLLNIAKKLRNFSYNVT